MKKLILLVAIIATTCAQKTWAQENAGEPLQKVITAYLNVKNALTNDNSDSVRAASKNLYQAINDVEPEKLSSSQRKVWTEYKEKLSYDAEHMKQTDELEHQREHFTKLSVNFYKVLKGININTSDLYYQFCPMANDGKGGYWLSEKQNVVNPYFGKKMPACGSTKETLKGNH